MICHCHCEHGCAVAAARGVFPLARRLARRDSDGETERPLLDRTRLPEARPEGWRWDAWASSGQDRFQGGTLAGIRARLPYLKRLGVTTLWLSPVFKQRAHVDSYHGYGIQDFLEVDPHFGTRVLGAGELIAWSRILDGDEALCAVNGHGTDPRGGDVLVDLGLSPAGSSLTVVLNTAEAGGAANGAHPVGSTVAVERTDDGAAFVAIRNLPPSEVLVLVNQP
jgi:Alpha amylase, catalytic domain/Alpha amylase, C-terminal all-beta domain